MSFDEKDLNLEGQEERSSKVNSKNRIQEGSHPTKTFSKQVKAH